MLATGARSTSGIEDQNADPVRRNVDAAMASSIG